MLCTKYYTNKIFDIKTQKKPSFFQRKGYHMLFDKID